jgi:transposase
MLSTASTASCDSGSGWQPAIRVIGKVADAYAVLHATIDAPEAPLAEPVNGFVGVDMGIVNIATTSTGSRASGAPLNR